MVWLLRYFPKYQVILHLWGMKHFLSLMQQSVDRHSQKLPTKTISDQEKVFTFSAPE